MEEYNELEELRKKYYHSVKDLELDDMVGALPLPGQKNFTELVKGIVDLIKKDLDAAILLSTEVKTEKEKEEIKIDIDTISKKLKLVNDYIDFCINELNNEELPIVEGKLCNIICCRFDNGNCPLIRDLKNIPREYYPQIMEVLDNLEIGKLDYNPEKTRRMSGNSKLKGLTESKKWQVRVFFKVLPNNTIYIEMIRLKKDNHSLRDSKEPTKRKFNIRHDCEKLKIALKKNTNENDFSNREIDYEEVRKYISSKIKKGGKKNHGKK